MHTKLLIAAAAFSTSMLAASNVAIAQQNRADAGSGSVASTRANYSKSMEELQRAAQRLRESIQALAQQQPGPKRDDAIRAAHQALYDTQQAMLRLPPELRNAPSSAAAQGDYSQSLKKLQSAADRLYNALHSMAKQSKVEGRNSAIRQAREALFEAEQAMLQSPLAVGATEGGASGAAGGRSGADAKPKGRDAKDAAATGPAIVLFPPLIVSTDRFAEGCWTRLYSENNYGGDLLTLAGPGDMTHFKVAGASGTLFRKWDSMIVGPKATVTVYDNENFTQPVGTFKPGQRISDLDDRLGLLANVRGVRLACGGKT